jgi:VWFA-related protein
LLPPLATLIITKHSMRGSARSGSRPPPIAGVLAGALLATGLAGQEPPAVPSFPSQTAAITVDVVVLDSSGQPVRDLARADFTVLEDGRPQAIVGFEARALPTASPASEVVVAPERVVTNVAPAATGSPRVFGVLIDDLGLSPAVAAQVKPAIGGWLRERALPSDEVTLLTTSGDLWWSDQVGRGREDLLAVLERVKGKGQARPTTGEWMSQSEAYRIAVYEDQGEGGGGVNSRGEPPPPLPAGPPQQQGPTASGQSLTVTDRVSSRWFQAGVCLPCLNCNPPDAECKSRVRAVAGEIHAEWQRRALSVLNTIGRVSAELAALSGRKSLLLVSEEFLRDTLLEDRFRAAIDAAQRSNTSVYFTGARGLAGMSFGGADARVAPRGGDIQTMDVEDTLIAVGGAEQLAESTGGLAVTTSNDLSSGLDRMATDASAYYLLGYQPEQAPDGKWHKLEVKVARPGVTVRARRGYRAGPPEREAARTGAGGAEGKGGKAKAKPAGPPLELLAGGDRNAIPLRMATYLQAPDGAGSARILVVLEIDGERIRVAQSATGAKASLGLTILAVARDRPKVLPLDQTLDLKLGERDLGGWWALFREVRLPPGIAQIRALVRDTATGAVGSVSQRVDVPDIDKPYLSTPILTDRIQPPLAAGEPPRLVPTAVRRFRPQGQLFCQYEVFTFAGQNMPGVPRVMGGYTLRAGDGRVIAIVPPTLIGSDGNRVVRRLAIPVEGLAPGSYELLLTVEDDLANRPMSARESFTIVPEAPPDVSGKPGS